MKTITHHYVRMEQMNHHGSLYAGILTDWMTEAAFFGVAQILGRRDHIVMCAVQDFRFTAPAGLGDILSFRYELARVGRTSLTIAVEARNMLEPENVYATCQVVFVNTDENGKSAPLEPLDVEKNTQEKAQ